MCIEKYTVLRLILITNSWIGKVIMTSKGPSFGSNVKSCLFSTYLSKIRKVEYISVFFLKSSPSLLIRKYIIRENDILLSSDFIKRKVENKPILTRRVKRNCYLDAVKSANKFISKLGLIDVLNARNPNKIKTH